MAIKGGYNRKGLPKDKDGLPGKQKGNLRIAGQTKRELALSLSADVYADRERACSRLPMTRKPRRRLQRHGLRHNPSFL